MVVSFAKKEVAIKNYDTLQLLVEKFIVYNLSAPHEWGILELKGKLCSCETWSHEHNQLGVV
jgi:hypothetical protein